VKDEPKNIKPHYFPTIPSSFPHTFQHQQYRTRYFSTTSSHTIPLHLMNDAINNNSSSSSSSPKGAKPTNVKSPMSSSISSNESAPLLRGKSSPGSNLASSSDRPISSLVYEKAQFLKPPTEAHPAFGPYASSSSESLPPYTHHEEQVSTSENSQAKKKQSTWTKTSESIVKGDNRGLLTSRQGFEEYLEE